MVVVVVAVVAAAEVSYRMVQAHLVVDIVVLVLLAAEVDNSAVAELVWDSHHLHHNCTLVEEDDHTEKVEAVTLMLPVTSRSLFSL